MLLKILTGILIFFLPLHALIITTLKCKFDINTDFLRFWKEGIVIALLSFVFAKVYKDNNFSLKKIYKDNILLGTVTAFIICSIVFIFFPFFEIKAASILGFRYDVFFLLTLIIGLYLSNGMKDLWYYLSLLFISTFWVLIVFLPWYLFGDISALASIFGYSSEVSTYTANECISFAQNVNGQHRFQWSFGWPIRFSVFLTIVLSLFAGYILQYKDIKPSHKYIILGGMSALILPAIFFSYSKTSILGLIVTAGVFTYLVRRYIYNKRITQKFLLHLGAITSIPVVFIVIFKWDLFLHLWSVLNRLDNLSKSFEMFFYNPIWYGLWIAGPASQIGNSIESAGNWQTATATVSKVHKFLPENWYIQILLEQGVVWFFLFISVLLIIGLRLFSLVKKRKDYMSIGIFTAFIALCFMANFTHAFEEAATSYILFLIIGIYLAHTIHESKK